MRQLRPVGQAEKIVFPLVLALLVGMLLPDAAPLVGMFAFGNLQRECGVVDRLADTSRNALINIVTLALGLTTHELAYEFQIQPLQFKVQLLVNA